MKTETCHMGRKRNGNEPPVLAVLRAVFEGETGLTGGPLQMLTALLLRCDSNRVDPRTDSTFHMTLEELAKVSLTSTASAQRWRLKLRESGYLKFADPEGKRVATEYEFSCKLAPDTTALPLVSQYEKPTPTEFSAAESAEPALPLVSQSGVPVSQSDKTSKENARPVPIPSPDPTDISVDTSSTRAREPFSQYSANVQDEIFETFGVSPLYDDPKMSSAIRMAYDSEVSLLVVVEECKKAATAFSEAAYSIRRFIPAIKMAANGRASSFNDRGMYTAAHDDATESARIKELTGTGV